MATSEGSPLTAQNGKNSGYRSFDGADGEVRIPDGKWHITPNARFEHLVKHGDRLSARAFRVYAFLQLQSMNRQGREQCVKDLDGEDKVFIDDVAAGVGMDRADVGRCLDEIDDCGLGERRWVTGKDGTRKKAIYSFAEPREPKIDSKMVRAPFWPGWLPDLPNIRAYLNRRRFRDFPEDECARTIFIEKFEKGARLLRELDELFAREENSDGAHHSIYKEDRSTDIKRQTPPPSQPVLLEVLPAPEPPTATPEAPPVDLRVPAIKQIKPVGWLGEGLENNLSLKTEVEKHLKPFDVPDSLSEEMLAEIAKPITTQGILDQFKEATALDRVKPRTWGFFLKKAKEVAEDWPRYAAAKSGVGNGSPPGGPPTRSELRRRELIRRLAVEEDEP